MIWETIALGDIFKVTSGGTPSRKRPEFYENGNIHWVKTGDLHNKYVETASEFITKEALDSSSTKLYPPGTVLIAMYGATIGACSILNIEACTNQACAAFTPNDKVDSQYLYYLLKSKKNTFVRAGAGGAQPNISATFLKQFKIPLPALSVQKQIAKVLEKADTLRGQCQQMEQELNTLAQSVFLDMFGDPVKNPKGWDKCTLGELAEVKGGLQVTHKREVNPIEVPYLRVANVYRDSLFLDEIKLIKVTDKELERTKLIKGDMLVVEGHGNKLEIGRTAIWDDSIEDCTHQNHLIRARFDQDKILPQFVSCYLNSEGGRLQVLSLSKTTSGLNTISTNNVRSINLIVPPLPEQEKYLSIYDDIQNKLVMCKKLYGLHTEEFNSMMQRAFKGELELKRVA